MWHIYTVRAHQSSDMILWRNHHRETICNYYLFYVKIIPFCMDDRCVLAIPGRQGGSFNVLEENCSLLSTVCAFRCFEMTTLHLDRVPYLSDYPYMWITKQFAKKVSWVWMRLQKSVCVGFIEMHITELINHRLRSHSFFLL